MISKAKKIEQIESGKKLIDESGTLIFADFGGTKTEDLRGLRTALKAVGATYRVIKKRLLAIILKEKGIEFDPKQFQAQVGTIFVKGDISDAAGPVYRFSKEKEQFKILGGLDVENKSPIGSEIIIAIGKLPSREVLLAQLAGMLSSPFRAFMYVLSEKSKRSQASNLAG